MITKNLSRKLACTAMFAALMSSSALALAVQEMNTAALAGTWSLVDAPEIHADGSRGNTFGANPKGLLIIDSSGQYSLQIYSSDRPKFASPDRRQASLEELRATVMGMSTHTGHCTLDAEHGVIIFKIESASRLNWEGTEQKRSYELKGDELTYQVPASASGNGTTAISVWRKIR